MSEKAIAKGKMTNDQAKDILRLFRPGTADAADPTFAEAMELCERDPEMNQWFARHCDLYTALRSKFKQISVPEGFKEQIIAERRVHTTPLWQRAVLFAGAVAAIIMVTLTMRQQWRPAEPQNFAAYRSYMGGFAQRAYGMDINTDNLDQIRTYLAEKNAIADYVLPASLEKNAKAAGCVATTWHGKNVSMICFQSGRPLSPNYASDLWLFVTDRTTTRDTPTSPAPHFETANGIVTASWTVGNRTYVLATEGDEQFLSKFVSNKAVL